MLSKLEMTICIWVCKIIYKLSEHLTLKEDINYMMTKIGYIELPMLFEISESKEQLTFPSNKVMFS